MKKLVGFILAICLICTIGISVFANEAISIMVDGVYQYPDVPPQIIENRTMVPVRFLAELFGCEVGWDESTQTVIITSKEAIELRNQITIAEYEAITDNMTYEQIVAIIGGPGELTYEYDFGENDFLGYRWSKTYRWEGINGYGSAIISFKDNIIDSKNRYSLKT